MTQQAQVMNRREKFPGAGRPVWPGRWGVSGAAAGPQSDGEPAGRQAPCQMSSHTLAPTRGAGRWVNQEPGARRPPCLRKAQA